MPASDAVEETQPIALAAHLLAANRTPHRIGTRRERENNLGRAQLVGAASSHGRGARRACRHSARRRTRVREVAWTHSSGLRVVGLG
eukprot:2741699-Pleurochrysis_carterae.AAC.1